MYCRRLTVITRHLVSGGLTRVWLLAGWILISHSAFAKHTTPPVTGVPQVSAEYTSVVAKPQGADVALLRAAGAEALERIHAVQVEVVRDRMDSHLRCPPQYRAEPGDDPREVLCSGVVAALGKLGYVPWGVNCSTIRYTGAHGCEADMTFVRPQSFDEKLVRSLCVPMRSCGPNAWSKRLVAHPDFRVWASQ